MCLFRYVSILVLWVSVSLLVKSQEYVTMDYPDIPNAYDAIFVDHVSGYASGVVKSAYGQYFGHGYGHSLGLEVHEGPNPNPGNSNPMPAGAVCSAEPGIYIPGKFGVRIEDVTIVRENGAEIITGSPKNLIIV